MAELPVFYASDSTQWYQSRQNLPPITAPTTTFPPGSVVAYQRDGMDTDCIYEIVRFVPPIMAPTFTAPARIRHEDPTTSHYVVRHVTTGDETTLECEEVHDPQGWRRMDTTTKSADGMKECDGCKKSGRDFKKCSACSGVYYCNRECQRHYWKRHKSTCLRIRGQAVSASVLESEKNARLRDEAAQNDASLEGREVQPPRPDGVVAVCGGAFIPLQEDYYVTNIVESLKVSGQHHYQLVDLTDDAHLTALCNKIISGGVRSVILRGVGTGGDYEWTKLVLLRATLLKLVELGGSLFLIGEGPLIQQWFQRFGKKWKCTGYTRYDLSFNTRWGGDCAAFQNHALFPKEEFYTIKGVVSNNVPVEEVVYCDEQDTMMAAGRCGRGWVSFVGCVNAETVTTCAIAILLDLFQEQL